MVIHCEACKAPVTHPLWNPYEGVWGCPICDAEMDIDGWPRDVEIPFTYVNPDL